MNWVALVALIGFGLAEEAKCVEEPRLPALRRELLDMMRADQQARARLLGGEAEPDPEAVETVRRFDVRHTRRLKEMVAKHGWPGRTLVGRDGARAAWLLVQHADHDREFQQACLARMRKLPAGEVEAADLAYLTDRVLIGKGLPQRYGTQLVWKDGKLEPRPLEDPDRVDERRRSIGLTSLAEYRKFAEEGTRRLGGSSGKIRE